MKHNTVYTSHLRSILNDDSLPAPDPYGSEAHASKETITTIPVDGLCKGMPVMVRSFDRHEWRATIFDSYDLARFKTLNGVYFDQCAPLDLTILGTNKPAHVIYA